MNILLVEDSARKAERIEAFLLREFDNSNIRVVRSYQGALRQIRQEAFDVVLLDMTLPTFDPSPRVRFGRPRPLGGRDLMAKMERRGVSARVIVVTQLDRFGTDDEEYNFQQVKELCEQDYPKLFVGAVFFSQSNNLWEAELKRLVSG